MSHKINIKIDKVYLAEIPELYNGKGWHGLGIPNKEFTVETLNPVLFEHFYAQAGAMTNNGIFTPTEQKYACYSDGSPIGHAVGEDWDTPSNLELFNIFKDALAGSQYKIVSCGTIDSRVEFFIDAKGENIKAANRDIAPFVGLHRMFGGKGSLECSGHNTVIQCGNTTALFLREAEKSENAVRTKNSKYVQQRMEWFQKQIEMVHGVHSEFARAMDEAQNELVTYNEATKAFVGAICVQDRLTTRTVNRANRLHELFRYGNGNDGETLVDWHGAITDYFSHESAGDPDNVEDGDRLGLRIKQFYSSEYGSGRKFKAEITNKLFKRGEPDLNYWVDLQARGQVIINRSDYDVVSDLAHSN